MEFKSGFVSIIGRPNVGKSTLMNKLVGEKIAITSNKPNTTRNRIQSILTTDDGQVIFIDTPGLLENPNNKLGEFLKKSARSTFNEVDILLFVIEPDKRIGRVDKSIIESIQSIKSPIFLIINKIDTVKKDDLLEIIDLYQKAYNFAEIIPVSAINDSLNDLVATIFKYLPQGIKYFPDDMITDQPERHLVSELLREKALRLLQEEIPHGIAVEIITMKKRKNNNLIDIHANIYCEKDSHKRIIIGKNGEMLKKISTYAREDIERLLGSKIFLQTWVKVKKNWRDNDFLLKNFGYKNYD